MLVVTVAVIGSTGIRANAAPKAETVQVNGFAVPVNHVGPGVGSVKHAPFVHIDSSSTRGTGRWYHHTGEGAKATAPVVHQGPGPGSSKTPYAR